MSKTSDDSLFAAGQSLIIIRDWPAANDESSKLFDIIKPGRRVKIVCSVQEQFLKCVEIGLVVCTEPRLRVDESTFIQIKEGFHKV